MKYNLGAGKHPLEGWTNVDHANIPGIDVVADLFSYPWGFPDNSGAEFFCSHIIEHIPHEPKPSQLSDAMYPRWEELKDLDGFFCFFSEIWRIGKPDAKVRIVCPFGYTRGAFQDPTHTRYIVPASFAYLTEECKNGPDFDYNVPCLYEVTQCAMELMDRESLGLNEQEYDFAIGHTWDIARNMHVELRIIK